MPTIITDLESAGRVAAIAELDELVFQLRNAFRSQTWQRQLQAVMPDDLEISTVRLLRAVEQQSPDAPTIGTVAEILAIDPSTASRLADRAVRGGYLERQKSASDGRKTQLLPTASGLTVLEDVTRLRQAFLKEAAGEIEDADLVTFIGMLQNLLGGFARIT